MFPEGVSFCFLKTGANNLVLEAMLVPGYASILLSFSPELLSFPPEL